MPSRGVSRSNAVRVVDGGGRAFAPLLRIDPAFVVPPTEIHIAARLTPLIVLWNVPSSLAVGMVRACRDAGAAVVVCNEDYSDVTGKAAIREGASAAVEISDDAVAEGYAKVIRAAVRAELASRRPRRRIRRVG